jgi:hypothetical protein
MRVPARLNINVALMAVPIDENAPPSPGPLPYNQDNKTHIQRQAIRDLRLLHRANRGKLPCDAVIAIVEKYKKHGTNFVMLNNLRYCLKLEKIGKKTNDELGDDDQPIDVVGKTAFCTVDSPLSEEEIVMSGRWLDDDLIDDWNVEEELEDKQEKALSESSSKKSAGHPLGSTNIKAKQDLIARCITEAAVALDEGHQKCFESGRKRVQNGTLDTIIKEIEEKNQMEKGTINRETVKSRVTQGNLECTHPLRISLLFLIGHVIVEYYILLSRMGSALLKDVMELTNDLIKGTIHARKLKAYSSKRGLTYDEDNLVGEGWYRGILKQNAEFIKIQWCKVQDCKRHTYCTYNNISLMYDYVYDRMVEAGVANKLDEPVMLDKDGNIKYCCR